MLQLAAGCGRFVPGRTLHATRVESVPTPNGLVETPLWGKVPTLKVTLRRGAGAGAPSLGVRLQAVHDGRAVSILARWDDDTETFVRRAWVRDPRTQKLEEEDNSMKDLRRREWKWDAGRGEYLLDEQKVDQFAFAWPMSGSPAACMLAGRPAVFDVWQWRAGWSDLSGYADDRRMILAVHPEGTRPESVGGPLYPARSGRRRVEVTWREDSGVPGTVALPRPTSFEHTIMPGAETRTASGSAADVQAYGVYQPATLAGAPGHWFVEFWRLLVTATDEEDCQMRGRGPFRFALAVTNNDSGANHYTSGSLWLKLDR